MGEGERDAGEPRYTAFLSYSHKDAAAAGKLHRRLETYRMPKRLVGTETPRGKVPERLSPIFRDRDELPAATDLSETVKQALDESGALIILCSPHAAGSLWVAEEIRVFRELHPDRPILAAVLEADPPHCFPPVLREFGQDGTWHEPLATDLRRHCDGPRLGLLKLVAGITGVGLDALVQRDAQRKIRRITAITAAAVVAMLVMVAMLLVAIQARGEAERQRAEAEGHIEFMLTDLREQLRSVGRLRIMTAVNQQALRYFERQRPEDLGPDSLELRARVLLAMGEDDLTRDKYSQALAAFREAHRTTAEQLAREPNNPARLFAHSQSEYWIGYVGFRAALRLRQAQRAHAPDTPREVVLRALRRNLAPVRETWQRYVGLTDRLLAVDPHDPRWLREAGYARGNLCTIAVEMAADPRGAVAVCSRALEIMREARRVAAGNPDLELDVGNRHAWLADAWRLSNNWDRVWAHRREQERLARWLIARDPNDFDYQEFWMRTQFTQGELLTAYGDARAAREWLRRAMATVRPLRLRDPENATWRYFEGQIAEARERLGDEDRGQ